MYHPVSAGNSSGPVNKHDPENEVGDFPGDESQDPREKGHNRGIWFQNPPTCNCECNCGGNRPNPQRFDGDFGWINEPVPDRFYPGPMPPFSGPLSPFPGPMTSFPAPAPVPAPFNPVQWGPVGGDSGPAPASQLRSINSVSNQVSSGPAGSVFPNSIQARSVSKNSGPSR